MGQTVKSIRRKKPTVEQAISAFMERIAVYDPDRDLWTFRFPVLSGVGAQMLIEECIDGG